MQKRIKMQFIDVFQRNRLLENILRKIFQRFLKEKRTKNNGMKK